MSHSRDLLIFNTVSKDLLGTREDSFKTSYQELLILNTDLQYELYKISTYGTRINPLIDLSYPLDVDLNLNLNQTSQSDMKVTDFSDFLKKSLTQLTLTRGFREEKVRKN